MVLSYLCKSCKKKNLLKIKAVDRFEFQKKIGADELNPRCKHCGTIEKRHINRFTAEPSESLVYLAIGLTMILTVVVFFMGFIATLALSIPIAIYYAAQRNASLFNKTKVRRN